MSSISFEQVLAATPQQIKETKHSVEFAWYLISRVHNESPPAQSAHRLFALNCEAGEPHKTHYALIFNTINMLRPEDCLDPAKLPAAFSSTDVPIEALLKCWKAVSDAHKVAAFGQAPMKGGGVGEVNVKVDLDPDLSEKSVAPFIKYLAKIDLCPMVGNGPVWATVFSMDQNMNSDKANYCQFVNSSGNNDRFLDLKRKRSGELQGGEVDPELQCMADDLIAHDPIIVQLGQALNHVGASIQLPVDDSLGVLPTRVALLQMACVAFMGSSFNDDRVPKVPFPVMVKAGLEPARFLEMKDRELKKLDSHTVNHFFDSFAAKFPASLYFAEKFATDGRHVLNEKRKRSTRSFIPPAPSATGTQSTIQVASKRNPQKDRLCFKCRRVGNDCNKVFAPGQTNKVCSWEGVEGLLSIAPGCEPHRPLLTTQDRLQWTPNDVAKISFMLK